MKLLWFLVAFAAVVNGELEIYINDVKYELEDPAVAQALDITYLSVIKGNPEDLVSIEELPIEDRNIINDKIREGIENFRAQMNVGFPEKGIPPLDPFELPDVSYKYWVPLVFRANYNLKNGLVKGLQNFDILTVDFKVLKLTFEFEFLFKRITYDTDWELNGKISLWVPYNYGGNFRLRLYNFDFSGKAALATNLQGYLRLKSLELYTTVEKTTIHFDNIVGNGPLNEIINYLLSKVVDGTLKKMISNMADQIAQNMFDAINEWLSGIKLSDIIG